MLSSKYIAISPWCIVYSSRVKIMYVSSSEIRYCLAVFIKCLGPDVSITYGD